MFCRHLIGFFLFLTLTIYTAMKIPYVVDLPKFEHVREELKTSLPLAHVLPSLSSWRSNKLLTNCIPEEQRNHSDICLLVSSFILFCIICLLRYVSTAAIYFIYISPIGTMYCQPNTQIDVRLVVLTWACLLRLSTQASLIMCLSQSGGLIR